MPFHCRVRLCILFWFFRSICIWRGLGIQPFLFSSFLRIGINSRWFSPLHFDSIHPQPVHIAPFGMIFILPDFLHTGHSVLLSLRILCHLRLFSSVHVPLCIVALAVLLYIGCPHIVHVGGVFFLIFTPVVLKES